MQVGDGRFPVAAVGGEPVVDGTKVDRRRAARAPACSRADGTASVAATVRAVEWLGHERHVICDVAGTNVIVRQPSEGTPPGRRRAPSASARRPDEIHLFSPDTTERLN